MKRAGGPAMQQTTGLRMYLAIDLLSHEIEIQM